ncbi:guanidinoacetate N-methyltransferase [Malassezia sp. CBS 17886]|nr:guanidinoacetate N-methyltransferase [Malassezia sp. CBS 17886]
MATSGAHMAIQAGDAVIVFASRDRTPTPIQVTRGAELVNLYGSFAHDDMIGRPYGSKIHSRNRRGFVYLLRPTPELWTVSLPHRTQILYAPDMSFITMRLNLSPGATVIEAGTGSGSFTHVLARAVGRAEQTSSVWRPADADGPPTATDADAAAGVCDDAPAPARGGRVWSFEFHAERVDKARAEFAAHGVDRTVVLQHRNVCKNGFGLENAADAVFLDLPAPWEAIPHARAALRTRVATHICCFSPCIEQVLRTVTALSEHGFTDVATYESLVRTHESLTNVAPLESITDVVERIRASEHKREARRDMQMAQSQQQRERREAERRSAEGTAAERGAEEDAGGDAVGGHGAVDASVAETAPRPAVDDAATGRRPAVPAAATARALAAASTDAEEAAHRNDPSPPSAGTKPNLLPRRSRTPW